MLQNVKCLLKFKIIQQINKTDNKLQLHQCFTADLSRNYCIIHIKSR